MTTARDKCEECGRPRDKCPAAQARAARRRAAHDAAAREWRETESARQEQDLAAVHAAG